MTKASLFTPVAVAALLFLPEPALSNPARPHQAAPAAAPQTCTPAPLPPPALAPWQHAAGTAKGQALRAGVATDLALAADAAQAGTYSGAIAFTAPAAGTWRVALGAKGWIDVLRAGTAMTSTSHEHGPACSGIRKIVAFDLAAGAYVLRLSRVETQTVRVLVFAEPAAEGQ